MRGFGFGGFGGGGRGPGGGGPGGPGGGAPGGGGRGPGIDWEKMQAQREEAAKKAQDLLDEVLPPEGLNRLIGLYVQLRGNSSITGELPAKKLGLSEDDIGKISEASGNVMREAFQASAVAVVKVATVPAQNREPSPETTEVHASKPLASCSQADCCKFVATIA